MNDKLVNEYEIRTSVTGAQNAEQALRNLQKTTDDYTRSGVLTEKQQTAITKSLFKQSQALDQTNTSMRAVVTESGRYAKHAGDIEKSSTASVGSLSSLRYAMYDVARTAGTMSAAIGAAGAGALVLSSQYESAFTAVERTSGVTGQAVEKLRGEFLQLSREIPQSFAEIANIGARGAQLGVATEDLSRFTEVVAQFVATSDTVSLGEAVEAFGRISNLLGDTDFNRIGSSITMVGVNAAATEAQIVKTTQELAPFATAVGMSADETIGLAAALGSLGQPPERARSAFLTLQRVMDTAIASGSENLDQFANLLGTTTDEVATLWKQDPGQFISAFASSLGGVEDLTSAFAALGINERRAVQVFQALAADSRNAGEGMSVLNQAFQDAETGYTDGTELARQYALIVDDLASKWRIFLNALQEFGATVGSTLAPAAKGLLDILSGIVQGLSDFMSTPFGKSVTVTTAIVSGLVFVLTSLVTTVALGGAALLGFAQVTKGLTAVAGGTTLSLRSMGAAFQTVAAQAGISTRSLAIFKGALVSTGIGLAVVALGALANAFMQAGVSAEETFSKYVSDTGGLAEAVAADTAAYNEAIAAGNTDAASSFTLLNSSTGEAAAKGEEISQAYRDAAEVLGVSLTSGVSAATSAVEEQTSVLGSNTTEWLRNSLMRSQAFQELFNDSSFADAWREIGADFDEVIQIAAAEGEQGVLNYFYALSNATENGGGAVLSGIRGVGSQIIDTFKLIGQQIEQAWGSLISGNFKNMPNPADLFAGLDKVWSQKPLQKGFTETAKLTSGMATLAGQAGRTGKAFVDSSDDLEDWGNSAGGAGDQAAKAEQKIRTLVDYAGDLSKVWGRAFEIRFSGQQALDQITSSFQAMRDAADEARKKIRDLNNDMRALTSDINIQEYFLSIAVEYGDTKRAAAIEANLAKMRAELADKTAAVQKEQDTLNKGLTGNSKSAIENRKQILGLVSQYQSYMQAMAASGASQAELSVLNEQLKRDFIAQATQLGFNRAELGTYAKSFDDVAVAIAKVPRNITVKANTNPAIQAFNEMKASSDRANRSLNTLRQNAGRAISMPGIANNNNAKEQRRYALEAEMAVHARNANMLSAAGGAANMQGARLSAYEAARIRALLKSGNFWTGGFTGRGGKYEPKGTVHGGEYVIPKHDVNQSTGLPTQDALGRLMGGAPSRSVAPASSGGSAGGVSLVSLDARSIQAIAQSVPKYIVMNDKLVGEATSNAYAHSTSVGGN